MMKEVRFPVSADVMSGSSIPEETYSTREDIHHTLIRRIRFNRFDLKYMSDIGRKYVAAKIPLSEGQNKLWEQLIHKYRKQFRKMGVNYKDILALTWTVGVRSLEELHAEQKFSLALNSEDQLYMYLQFNFHKKMIDRVRSIVHDDEGKYLRKNMETYIGQGIKYEFAWNPDDKIWKGPFDVHLFKALYNFCKHWDVRTDGTADTMYNMFVDAYGDDNDICAPYLTYEYDKLVVLNSNKFLDAKITDEMLANTNLKNVEMLCNQFGLTPPEEILEDYVKLMTIQTNETISIDSLDAIEQIALYLQDTGRMALFIFDDYRPTTKVPFSIPEIKDAVAQTGLDFLMVNSLNGFNEQRLLDSGFDAIVTEIPYTSLISSNRGYANLAKNIKKIITINADDSNNTN